MPIPKGQTNILFIFLFLIFSILFAVTAAGLPNILPIAIIIGFILFFIAFLRTDFALIFLIFFMLLSPEFRFGAVRGREVVLRLDDIFLFAIFLGWFARMAVNKGLGLMLKTPLNKPIIAYLLICSVSTVLGVLKNYASFNVSFFYLLKYSEYYLLFFMVANNLKEYGQIKQFIYSLIAVAFVVSVYACFMRYQGMARVSAPFEGKVGEANTLGGYLVLMMSVVISLIVHENSSRKKLIFLLVLAFMAPALIFTFSRGSWLAFVVSYLGLIFFSRKGKLVLAGVGMIVLIFQTVIFPPEFYDRIQYTFSGGSWSREYEVFGRKLILEDSAATRIELFKFALDRLKKEPLIGYGVGSSIPNLDNQYTRILIEVGILGFFVFLWLLLSIYRSALNSLRDLRSDVFGSSLAIGLICGFLGLMVHGFGAETFIIIRIMEPFWFLVASVVMLPHLFVENKRLLEAERGG